MANVIDTLIVELALDPSKFTVGQQAAVAAARQMTAQLTMYAKEIEAAGARVTHFFEQAKREVLGLLGLFLGGRTVQQFITETGRLDQAMVHSARTIGISTEQLAKWGVMARETGGDLQSVTGSLQGLSDRIAQAQITGDWGNLLQIFSRFGINLKTTREGLIDIDNLLDQLNATFSKMDPVSARAILSMLGLDPSTINLLIRQRSEFVKLREEAAALAKGMDEDAAASAKMYESFERTESRMARWGQWIVAQFAPTLEKLSDALGKMFAIPGTPEGDKVVRENEAEIRRRFGESPLFPVGPPMNILATRWAAGDTGIEDYNNPNLRPDQRAGVPFGYSGRGHFASYLAAGPTERSSSGTTNNSTSTTTIGTVNVTISGADGPEETGRSVYRWFQRFSQGASTYNGPH